MSRANTTHPNESSKYAAINVFSDRCHHMEDETSDVVDPQACGMEEVAIEKS